MRLLSIIETTAPSPDKSLRETVLEKIRSGVQLTEAEVELVAQKLSESDPFSSHSSNLLSDDDLQSLGLTREGLEAASFNPIDPGREVVDPFELANDEGEQQPGVTVGTHPDDLGHGAGVPPQEVPETIITMNTDMEMGEVPGVPGYKPEPTRQPAPAPAQPASEPVAQAPQEPAEPEEELETRPFPRRRPTNESVKPRTQQAKPAPVPESNLMEGLGGMKKLQKLKNGGQRNNISPEALVASLGLS